jgi:hypothetical protein
MLLAIASGLRAFVSGWKTPEAISQTYDAVFHYNAVAMIVETGHASPFFLGTLMNPGTSAKYYPGAWHALTALTQLSTGASTVVAANVVSALIAVVAWPAGCVLLVRQLLGNQRWISLAVPLLSLSFLAFPWTLLKWGVLWPNVLGLALVPVAMAAVLSLANLAAQDAIGRRQAMFLLPLAILGIGLAHPNALASLLVVLSPVLAVAAVRLAVRRPMVATAAAIVAISVATWIATTSRLLKATMSAIWPPFENPGQAIGEALSLATNLNGEAFLPASARHPVYLVLAGLIVAGCVRAWPRPAWRWLVISHGIVIALYTLAAATDSFAARLLTGLWYKDSYRLAAMLALTGVPLAALGLEAIARAVASVLAGRRKLAMAAVLTTALLVTGGAYQADRRVMVAGTYHGLPADSTLVTPQEQAFFRAVAKVVPKGQVVAGNPWNGSPMLYPMTGTKVLFQHLEGTWTEDQRTLASHLIDATPDACLAAQRLHVQYLITGGPSFWEWAKMAGDYPGLADPEGKPGFVLVLAHGPHRLYRLTACELGNHNY